VLKINEIFHSIQGESTYSGLPCVFIRLTGCNLRCAYCDTAHAYDEGFFLDAETVVERAKAFSCPLVEITGGEPLLQPETPELARKLLNEKFTVLVETNGSLNIDMLPEKAVRIVDFKCPGSGCSDSNDMENLGRLRPFDEVKCVISDRADFEWAADLARRHGLDQKCAILFSPAAGKLAPDMLAEWILAEKLEIRLQVQLHKILWPHAEKGR
jgi:7-carboxy-7-deazaguanine synthase